jgi:nitrite reductase/ring-hydroxylating ferredoxin subunit
MTIQRVAILDELGDRCCKEFSIGTGDWPFKGFVVRLGDDVHAYQNFCVHAGHPLNFRPDDFLTKEKDAIICSSHGAMFEIDSGLCIAGPCPGKTLRRVPVRIEDGVVYVDGPDSA